VIILAAGSSSRIGYDIPKQFIKIAGKMIIEHTIEIFERHEKIDEIYLGVNSDYLEFMTAVTEKNRYRKIKKIYAGGKTRKESSKKGIDFIKDEDANVLIHDAVRPFVSDRIISECIRALDTHQAVDVAIPSSDTIIEITEKAFVQNIPNRRFLMRGQTPQAFRQQVIKKAHQLAELSPEVEATDDCGLVLKYSLADIYVIKGEEQNIKVTYAEDVFLADKIFQLKSEALTGYTDFRLLNGKVVVVFGSSRGIGHEIFSMAEKHGAKVFGFCRHNGVDVGSYEQVARALKDVSIAEGKIDYIVTTAGRLAIKKIEQRKYADILDEIQANYLGAIIVTKASLPYLKETKGRMLFFTSSSYTRGRGGFAAYSSAKAALVNFVQAVAEEVYEDGVKINVINPERTATPMRAENFGIEPENSLLKAVEVAEIALKTLLANFTGQVIDVRRTLRLENRMLSETNHEKAV